MPEPNKMILFYSGSTAGDSLPERALYEDAPAVMLTFFEMYEKRGDTIRRFERHAQKRKEEQDAKGQA